MTQYLNLGPAAVAVIYASIPNDVLKGKKGMHKEYSKQKYDGQYRLRAPMEMSREEWCAIWWASGKWHQRGQASDQFQMCRKNDLGGYSMGNVRIDTKLSNSIECGKGPKPFIATSTDTGEEFFCEHSRCDQVKQLGLDTGNVSKCLNGKRNSHKGFTFKYADNLTNLDKEEIL